MAAKRLSLIAAALVLAAASPAFADAGGIQVKQAWARATPGNAKTGAIYLTIINTGTTVDTLDGTASTPAAEHAELHETKMENGVMQMRPVTQLTIAPGKSVVLAPGGYHMMLTGLKAPLKQGQTVPITLSFAHAGPQHATASVESVGAMHGGAAGTPGSGSAADMDHGPSSMPGMAH